MAHLLSKDIDDDEEYDDDYDEDEDVDHDDFHFEQGIFFFFLFQINK